MTLAEATTVLAPYVGANNNAVDRINLVRARLLQQGNWPDTLRVIEIAVTEDASTTFPVIVLPAGYSTILAVAPKPANVTVLCGFLPLGVRNVFDWFSQASLGYGSRSYAVQELAPSTSTPGVKRYVVPTCVDGDYSYLCLVKLKYVALTDDDDEVTPNNIGALKAGLQALNAEDSDNRGLSRDLWAEAMALLAEQSENETGAAASGRLDFADDFELEMIGRGL